MPALTEPKRASTKDCRPGQCKRSKAQDGRAGDSPVADTKVAKSSTREAEVQSEKIDRMFRAFCDRTRLRILSLLRDGELCVGDIVEILQVPQPRVSRHLGHLKKAGLVLTRKSGTWVYYSLTRPKTAFHRKLLDCAITCFRDVPEIQADNAKAAKIKKSGGCCPDS